MSPQRAVRSAQKRKLPDCNFCSLCTAHRCVAILAVLASAFSAHAQAPRLGTVSFPTSGSPAAQSHFIIGVLYLHSFEYPSALKEFREAERVDPGFAMAYWGEAMTYTHPIWDEQDADAGRVAIAKAPKAKTAREAEYVAAVQALYGSGSKAHRDTLYSSAMADLAKHYPDDAEAQLFYALSLLGLSQGDRVIPTYLRAGAIAETVFAHQPDHPGAAHYVIHSYDDPQHAAIALKAARAYSTIAPDAAHAQHMTSHIFLALGLWDDVVIANETTLHLVHMGHQGGGACGHYPEWLGKLASASEILDACWTSGGTAGQVVSYASPAIMRAAYIVDSRDWSGRAAIEAARPASDSRTALYLLFGTGYAAAMRHDSKAAGSALTAMDSIIKLDPTFGATYGRIMRDEVAAAMTNIEDPAREAARIDDSLPMPFGPPVTIKPPHELLGELLLAANKPDAAITEFQLALARAPRRPMSLLGLARAQQAAGRTSAADSTYATLRQIWHAADPTIRAELPR